MTFAEIQATYQCLRDDDIATLYHDHIHSISGALYYGTLIRRDERMEVSASSIAFCDLATAERRAHAVLAMCDWMRKVQKGEVK